MAELHRGLDLRAEVGTPVLAVIDSVVIGKWTETEGGVCLAMAGRCPDGTWPEPRSYFFQGMATEGKGGHDDSGWRVTYAHLSNYGPNCNVGAVVRKGEVVAFSGATGLDSNGQPVVPHLHIMTEWLQDGWTDTRVFIDPRILLGGTITGAERTHRLQPGRFIAPNAAIVQPSGAPAAQAKRESVVINVDGSGQTSINLGTGASVAGSLQLLPQGVF